jgi:putative endonuclease
MSGREHHYYYVYMVASKSHVLYCGVTNNLPRRMEQHRQGSLEGFTADYRCKRLVWFECFEHIDNAISREKQIKRWRREKKIALIKQANPTWLDLTESWSEETAGPSGQDANSS